MFLLVLALLQASFIFCKLAGLTAIASWTWLQVFVPLVLVACIWVFFILTAALIGFLEGWSRRRR